MPNDFDVSAKNYDVVFTYSKIGKAQRKLVQQYLSHKILQNKKLNILELNCGTGEDAIFFSENGHRVLATDVSEEMIQISKSKNKNTTIRFVQQDINTITSATFNERFDLIFSNFGGLNCITHSQLKSFIKVSSSLILSEGKMVLVIMPKKCLWEKFYFILKGQFKNAYRRNTNNSVMANVDGVKVPTWYYNPKEMVKLAKENYQTLTIKPIGICIPPSYLESLFTTRKRFLKILIRLEKLFSSNFWAKYGDHYLIAFQKRE